MLHDQIKDVNSKERLAEFVAALLQDLENNREGWENDTLDRFLEAMESWIRSMDNYYKNTDQPIPDTPTWRTFAEILLAARVYE